MWIDRRLAAVLMLIVVAVLCIGADNGAVTKPHYEVVASNGKFVRFDIYTGRSWLMTSDLRGRNKIWVPIYEANTQRANTNGAIILHGIKLLKHRR